MAYSHWRPGNNVQDKKKENKIEIYKNADNQTEITVPFDEDTGWLNQQ